MQGSPGGSVVKNLPAKARDTGDTGTIPDSGRSSGGGNGDPLQYSCLGNPQNRGAWGVCRVGSDWKHTRVHTHKLVRTYPPKEHA